MQRFPSNLKFLLNLFEYALVEVIVELLFNLCKIEKNPPFFRSVSEIGEVLVRFVPVFADIIYIGNKLLQRNVIKYCVERTMNHKITTVKSNNTSKLGISNRQIKNPILPIKANEYLLQHALQSISRRISSSLTNGDALCRKRTTLARRRKTWHIFLPECSRAPSGIPTPTLRNLLLLTPL